MNLEQRSQNPSVLGEEARKADAASQEPRCVWGDDGGVGAQPHTGFRAILCCRVKHAPETPCSIRGDHRPSVRHGIGSLCFIYAANLFLFYFMYFIFHLFLLVGG